MALEHALDRLALARRGCGAREQVPRVVRHPARDDDQQQADEDRRGRVPRRLAGELVQRNSRRGDADAHQRRRVLEEHQLDARVPALAHVEPQRLPGPPRLGPRLPQRPHPGRALRRQSDDERDPGDEEAAGGLAAAHDLGDAVAAREHRAGHEHRDRRDEGPQEALLPVAEGLPFARLAPAERDRGQQEDLVGGVGERVGGLGEERGRPADQAAPELRDRDQRVRREGDRNRLAAGARATCAGEAAPADLPSAAPGGVTGIHSTLGARIARVSAARAGGEAAG